MKTFILVIALLFSSQSFYGQCYIADLSQADKTQLQIFWDDLRQSINTNDTLKLISLCELPFYCGYCEKTKIKSAPDLIKYSFFFVKGFKEEINKHATPEGYFIVHGSFNTKYKGCSYIFPYTEPGGHILYFDVTKIKNAYKINSTWTKN